MKILNFSSPRKGIKALSLNYQTFENKTPFKIMKNKSFNAPFHNSTEKIKKKHFIVMEKKKLIQSCHRISLVINVKNMVHLL